MGLMLGLPAPPLMMRATFYYCANDGVVQLADGELGGGVRLGVVLGIFDRPGASSCVGLLLDTSRQGLRVGVHRGAQLRRSMFAPTVVSARYREKAQWGRQGV